MQDQLEGGLHEEEVEQELDDDLHEEDVEQDDLEEHLEQHVVLEVKELGEEVDGRLGHHPLHEKWPAG